VLATPQLHPKDCSTRSSDDLGEREEEASKAKRFPHPISQESQIPVGEHVHIGTHV